MTNFCLEMDDDYDMTIHSNVLTGKPSSTVKHINNNNEMTLLNQNTLNVSTAKCTRNTIMLPTTSSTTQSNGGNFLLTNGTNPTSANHIHPNTINSNDVLQSRLPFTSPKLINSRAALANNIAIECFETDTVDSSVIKEEPLSPDSSCPPSPITSVSTADANLLDATSHIIVTQPTTTQQTSTNSQFGTINVNLANVATYTNADLVFEHNKVSISCLFFFIYIYLFE